MLEPFTEGTASFFLREGRDLSTLSGWDLVRSRQAIGRDLVGFAGASLVAELVLRFGTDEPQPVLYEAVSGAFDRILDSAGATREQSVITAAWQIVALLGFAPQTGECVRCGRELGPSEEARFDAAGGGVSCAGCRPGRRALDPAARQELGRVVQGTLPPGEFTRPDLQRALLRAYLTGHFEHERPFRSLDLFIEQAGI